MRTFLLLLLLLSGIASANDAAMSCLEQFHHALASGDQKQALQLLRDDALIFESGYAENKSDYAAHHLAADIDYANATKTQAGVATVNCDTQLCLVTRQSETSGHFNSKPVHSITMETAVLKLQDGAWRIQHIHWSSRKAH